MTLEKYLLKRMMLNHEDNTFMVSLSAKENGIHIFIGQMSILGNEAEFLLNDNKLILLKNVKYISLKDSSEMQFDK